MPNSWSITANNMITICQNKDFLYWNTDTGSLTLKLDNESHTRPKGRNIGSISNEQGFQIYFKQVNPKKHFHYATNSYGIDSVVVNQCLNDNAIIWLQTTNNSKRSLSGYMIDVATLKQNTTEYLNFGKQTPGTELQLFCDVEKWKPIEWEKE